MRIVLCLLLIVSLYLQPQKTKYDKFKDETTVLIGPDYVDVKNGGRLEIAAYFSYKGQDKTNKLIIGLAFYSSSRNWRFIDDDHLIAIVDGERLDLGIPVSNERQLARRVGVDESLAFSLTREQFRKLGHASKVEMQLGRVEFRLKDKFLRDLKELNRLLN